MATTWRVRYYRKDSPYPVSIYLRGDDAEAKARARAADLRQSEQSESVRGVTVDPIEPPADGEPPHFSRSDLLATAPSGSCEIFSKKRKPGP